MRDVVRGVVTDVAPEELPLVAGLQGIDHETAVRRLRRMTSRKEPLGFGLEEITALVTAVVWIALDEALKGAVGAAVETARQRMVKRTRAILGRRDPDPSIPPLTREQLAVVHARVRESAVKLGISEKRAAQIADSLITRLALEPPKGEEE
nr:hypothetical protein GCM10020093_108170 [Planobispora longispora]